MNIENVSSSEPYEQQTRNPEIRRKAEEANGAGKILNRSVDSSGPRRQLELIVITDECLGCMMFPCRRGVVGKHYRCPEKLKMKRMRGKSIVVCP